jgi:hypothetical protein
MLQLMIPARLKPNHVVPEVWLKPGSADAPCILPAIVQPVDVP